MFLLKRRVLLYPTHITFGVLPNKVETFAHCELFKHDFSESRPSSEGLDWCICILHPYVYYIHMFVTSICVLHPYVCYIHMCITSICVLHPVYYMHVYYIHVYYIHMCMYDIHMCITSIFVSNSVHVCVCVCMCIHKWFLSKSDEGV